MGLRQSTWISVISGVFQEGILGHLIFDLPDVILVDISVAIYAVDTKVLAPYILTVSYCESFNLATWCSLSKAVFTLGPRARCPSTIIAEA